LKDFGIGGLEGGGECSALSSEDFGCFERTHSRKAGAWMGIGALEDITGVVDKKKTFEVFTLKRRSTEIGAIPHLIRTVDL
jgi:hypothetical protein